MNIILIHGAGLGSYIWKDVTRQLKHPIIAVDFPYREESVNQTKQLSVKDYLHTIIEQVDRQSKSELIIVAHSIGGVLGLLLADHYQDRLAGFVAVGAVIPKPGKSFLNSLPFPQRWIMPVILHIFGTKPPDRAIAQQLCNDLSEEQTKEVIDRFTPEAKSLYNTPLSSPGLPPSCRSLYVFLEKDRSVPFNLQQRMCYNLQAGETASIDAGHLPMLSAPGETARVLREFTEQ